MPVVFVTMGLVAAGLALLLVGGGRLGVLLPGALLVGIAAAMPVVASPLIVRLAYGERDYSRLFSQLTMLPLLLQAAAFYLVHRIAEAAGDLYPDGSPRGDYRISYAIGLGLVLLAAVLIPLGLRRARRLAR